MTVPASSTPLTFPANAGTRPPWLADLAAMEAALAPRQEHRMAPSAGLKRKPAPSDTAILLLLHGTQFTPGTAAWRYWCPRLALLAGLSAPEMAVLRADQIVRHIGRWWIEWPDDAASINRGWARRPVPVSHHLISDGFLDLVQTAGQARSDAFLFPTLARAQRPGDAARAWMRRWGGLHLPSEAISLHDLRMRFALCLARAGCSHLLIRDLLGRVPEKTFVATPSTTFQMASSWLPTFDAASFPGYRAPVVNPAVSHAHAVMAGTRASAGLPAMATAGVTVTPPTPAVVVPNMFPTISAQPVSASVEGNGSVAGEGLNDGANAAVGLATP